MKLGKVYLAGQTILETVIAATLIAVAVVAAISLSTNTQKETSYSRDLSIATKYNSQVVDWVRSVRNDLGWAAFYDKIDGDSTATYCLSAIPDLSVSFLTLPVSNQVDCKATPIGSSLFYRLAQFSIIDTDTIELKVTTYWPGNTEHVASTETTITNH